MLLEVQRQEEEVVVADVGCSRGHSKLFVGDLQSTQWIGLDLNIDEQALRDCGYSELFQCDFDEPLPLADSSVDVVVFSHVIEHLLRPEFAVGELSRILKPGGIIIAGSPVAPWPISSLREWQLRRRLRKRRIKLGRHINSMSPGRWKRLLDAHGMSLEFLTGTFFARLSGSLLENKVWWVRLNQLWGALLPGLGGEITLTARKSLSAQPKPQITDGRISNGLILYPKWALGFAAVLLACAGVITAYFGWPQKSCVIHTFVAEHQDGNDSFYLLPHDALSDVKPHVDIGIIDSYNEIAQKYQEESARGEDAFFLVSTHLLPKLNLILSQNGLRVIRKFQIDGHQFAVLSPEVNEHLPNAADG
ncbi:MAG: class I SAM-dependent methyltransferase [Planctomycetota bacterium]|nr:class I SAM-dependent methyltransferase [Planctomycetota bacterium]